jgi:hypothetical protein
MSRNPTTVMHITPLETRYEKVKVTHVYDRTPYIFMDLLGFAIQDEAYK